MAGRGVTGRPPGYAAMPGGSSGGAKHPLRGPAAPGLSPAAAAAATGAAYPAPGYPGPPRLPPLPGLKVRVPLCLGFVLSLAVRVANANAVGGVTTNAALFAAYPTLLTVRDTSACAAPRSCCRKTENSTHTGHLLGVAPPSPLPLTRHLLPASLQPAPWGFWIQGVIDAYQALGCFYAILTVGYRTNGTKERLVRIAGACWPFAWLCSMVVQWCEEQERLIACALFAQGIFAGAFVACTKLLPLAHKCSPVQRWAYITPSAMLAGWATLQSCMFFSMVPAKHGNQLPQWALMLMALACTALGCAMVLVPLASYPAAPPLSPYPIACAWVLAAAAVHANATSPPAAAGLGACAVLLACTALATSLNFVAAKSRGTQLEATPLVASAQGMASAAVDKYDALEQSLGEWAGRDRGVSQQQYGGTGRTSFPPLPPHPRTVLPPGGVGAPSLSSSAAAAVAAARGGGDGRRSLSPVPVSVAPPVTDAGGSSAAAPAVAAAAAKLRLHAAQQKWHDAKTEVDGAAVALHRAQQQSGGAAAGTVSFYRGADTVTGGGNSPAQVSPAVAAAQAAWHARLDVLAAAEAEVVSASQEAGRLGVRPGAAFARMQHSSSAVLNGMSRASSLHMGEGARLDDYDDEDGEFSQGGRAGYGPDGGPPSGYADAGSRPRGGPSGSVTPATQQFPVAYASGHASLKVKTRPLN